MISQKEATSRAKFFYKAIFGMNLIYPVKILKDSEIEEIMRIRAEDSQIFSKRLTSVHGYFWHVEDEGVGDPEEAEIIINRKRCNDVNKFNSTLIHELTHCALWWQGYEYDDGEYDFEKKLTELGLPSNYSHDYSKKSANPDKKEPTKEVMEKYENMYREHLRRQLMG